MTRSNVLGRADVAGAAPRPAVAEERCDSCCASACVYVVLSSGLDLVFCGHHARQFEPELRRSGAIVRGDARFAPLYW